MKKILICGAHLTPALATIEQLKNERVKIFFAGRVYATKTAKNLSAEYKTVTNLGIDFFQINAGKIERYFTKSFFLEILKIPLGFIEALLLIIKLRPNLIVSFGGYLSTPFVFGGWLLGIDSITHEQAVVPGLANKINSLFVKRIFISWPATARYFDKEKTELIGNCVRSSLFATGAKSKMINNFLDESNRLIFITGGNLGSHFINKLVFKSIGFLRGYSILHQVGTANLGKDQIVAQKIAKSSKKYLASPYLQPPEMGSVLKRATLVISRSGANTIWELALFQKPAILIPLPTSSGKEQIKNAQILEKAGAAKILDQNSLTPQDLIKAIEEVSINLKSYQKNASKFAKTLPKDAARKLSDFIKLTLNL